MNTVANKLGLQVIIKTCLYHLTQSTWRKIQSLGLTNRYREDVEIKHFCGMLSDGLAFLPIDRVADGFAFLRNNCPDVLEPLLEYVDAT